MINQKRWQCMSIGHAFLWGICFAHSVIQSKGCVGGSSIPNIPTSPEPYPNFIGTISKYLIRSIYQSWYFGTRWLLIRNPGLVLDNYKFGLNLAYGLKPEVWGRVGPDPRAELQVNLERGAAGPRAGSTCVASPEQTNSHLSDSIISWRTGI